MERARLLQVSPEKNFRNSLLSAMVMFEKDLLSQRVKEGIQRSKQKAKTPSVEAKRSLATN